MGNLGNIFCRLKDAQINSALIRKLLELYFKDGNVYNIPFGPLRGFKMHYERAINFHAVLGLWEVQNFEFLSKILIKGKLVKENMVICDVGADIGTYSLWFCRFLKNVAIYAFEPSPYIIGVLRKNLVINNATNVFVEELACADKNGKLEFFIGLHHHTSSLYNKPGQKQQAFKEKVLVNSTTLDDFFYRNGEKKGPDFIKMDIEGSGVFALKGCDRCIERKRPFFLIESHNPEEDLAISRILLCNDYGAYRIDNNQWVRSKSETFPNQDGVWGTLFLCPTETQKEVQCLLQ